MDQFNRFNKELEEARQSNELLQNEIFIKAVERVLNDYAKTEERLILEDNQKDFREQMKRVQHSAMMRRCLLDVVDVLNVYVNKGDAIRSLDE